jgi:cytochrome c biogenesis protein CcmG, thiol:disulfide interchange protein DsbE
VPEALVTAPRAGRRRGPWVAAAAAVVIAVWALVAVTTDPPPGDPVEPGRPVALDRPAPTFTRPLLAGDGKVSIGAQAGSVVVVNFWASWCQACRSEATSLADLSRSYGDRGVRFIGVDYEDRTAAALLAQRSFGLPYPTVTDPHGSVGDAFRIYGLPTSYIIGPDQRIRYMVAGRIDEPAFRAALDSVIATSHAGSG